MPRKKATSTQVVLTNEQGLIGGAPATGNEPGAGRNYRAMIDQPYQFDFYDGGGLELAFLSFAEVDESSDVNVSRFGKKIVGPGGFINISQNAKTMVFSGTFRAGDLEVETADGALRIVKEGRQGKFLREVEHVTYSGPSLPNEDSPRCMSPNAPCFAGAPMGSSSSRSPRASTLRSTCWPGWTPRYRSRRI